MPKYKVEVAETVAHRVMYVVEADSEGEAWARASEGDTYSECGLSYGDEVVERTVLSNPVLMPCEEEE